jgi:splicing factor U2AF subunit
MNVCDNLGDHLVGNVYIKVSLSMYVFCNLVYYASCIINVNSSQFRREEDAEKAVSDLNNRWFGGRPVYAELSPVTDFREACCRQYEMGLVPCLYNDLFGTAKIQFLLCVCEAFAPIVQHLLQVC